MFGRVAKELSFLSKHGTGSKMSRGLDLKRAEAALKRAAHKAVHGTREERAGRVISSALTNVNYDQRSRTLIVRFVTGRVYQYSDVPPEVYQGLLDADSKGAFFNTHVRDRYACREL
jgi:lysyl-tRNA synthetase class 2